MRHKSLIGTLLWLALLPAAALAQTPNKEPFPFDWLRHDATPSNRPGGSTFYPPVESLNDQKRRQQVEPSMEEPQVMAAPVDAAAPEVAPAQDREAMRADPNEPSAPMPAARPTVRSSAKARPAPSMDEIDIVNNRSVTLNELKLVSLKDSRKPFVVKPSLKPGQSLTVEIPRDWGCLFLVWTQFSEEPSEQHDGVDLCGDRKINLVN